jgi:hypothetical protein
VKLTFSRELDLPNLGKIKQLEQQFFSLPAPKYPKLFPGTFWLYLVLTFFWGAGIVQTIDAAAMDVFFAYRTYDIGGAIDVSTGMLGARIKF